MSKSRGNVVAPDEQVQKYGADTFRCYLMFIGPWEEGGPFRLDGISGIERWLSRAWNLALTEPAFGDGDAAAAREMRRLTHQTRPPRDRGLRRLPLEHGDRRADGDGERPLQAPARPAPSTARRGTRRSRRCC